MVGTGGGGNRKRGRPRGGKGGGRRGGQKNNSNVAPACRLQRRYADGRKGGVLTDEWSGRSSPLSAGVPSGHRGRCLKSLPRRNPRECVGDCVPAMMCSDGMHTAAHGTHVRRCTQCGHA